MDIYWLVLGALLGLMVVYIVVCLKDAHEVMKGAKVVRDRELKEKLLLEVWIWLAFGEFRDADWFEPLEVSEEDWYRTDL